MEWGCSCISLFLVWGAGVAGLVAVFSSILGAIWYQVCSCSTVLIIFYVVGSLFWVGIFLLNISVILLSASSFSMPIGKNDPEGVGFLYIQSAMLLYVFLYRWS